MNKDQLIKEFKDMLINKWGYKAGAAGIKINGRMYADCSGAFVYAVKRHGLSIYHGSNRIARKYIDKLLPIDKVHDGMICFKRKLPGTEGYNLPSEYRKGGTQYNGDLNDYYHCGLYVNGKVINLQSVATGCVESDVKSWHNCAYLKDVEYDNMITITMSKELYNKIKDVFK